MEKEKIDEMLNSNVELSEEEYKQIFEKASTNADGNIKKARKYAGKDVSEKTKHARIQSNFYGTAINFLSAMYDEMARMTDLLALALGIKEEEKKD